MAEQNKTIQTPPPEASVRTAAAQALIAKVRAIRDEIPDFTAPGFQGSGRGPGNAASVPMAFVERTAVAVANHPLLVRPDLLDPAVSRDLMTFAEAYTPLADEMEAVLKFLRHTIISARNTAGTDALVTYTLAQRLAKRAATKADLAPHVADMRRELGRHRKSKQVTAPTPAPAPTSAPVPASL